MIVREKTLVLNSTLFSGLKLDSAARQMPGHRRGTSSNGTFSPTRSASSKTGRLLRPTPLWKDAARNGSILRIASPPVLADATRAILSPQILTRSGDRVIRRSLDFYAAVGRRLEGLESGERQDAALVERGLEGEVDTASVLIADSLAIWTAILRGGSSGWSVLR